MPAIVACHRSQALLSVDCNRGSLSEFTGSDHHKSLAIVVTLNVQLKDSLTFLHPHQIEWVVQSRLSSLEVRSCRTIQGHEMAVATVGLKHAEDPHHVYREQVRIAERTGADRARRVLENRQIHQLWRAHFPERQRVQGELLRH